jgi:hypothetical protein
MNCDQVFDVLTRGPFPTGTSCDVPVEAHLNKCAECRQLAEALRPALELFQEAVDPEESRDLPGYWCGTADDSRRGTVSYAPELQSRSNTPRVSPRAAIVRRSAARTASRMAAMLALGVALGSLASAGWVLDGTAWAPFGNNTPVIPETTQELPARPALLERINLAVLPAACFRDGRAHDSPDRSPREQLLAGAELRGIGCCSGCHNSVADAVPRAATAKVAQSCQLCHAGNP